MQAETALDSQYPNTQDMLKLIHTHLVVSCYSLKTLETDLVRPDCFEYFTYKYSNIEKLIISTGMELQFKLPDYIGCLSDAVKSISWFEITFRLADPLEDWESIFAETFGRYFTNVRIGIPWIFELFTFSLS